MITVLCGGVGAARFLAGLVQVVPPAEVTAIVNVADDTVLHGLHISPDLDTITYTLAGAIDPDQGWGLGGETWAAMEALDRYGAVRPSGSGAAGTWFRLGDRDLATHLYRTHRHGEGASLSTVTDEIRRAWGLELLLLPVTDDRVETRLTVAGEGEIGFQEYFVGRRHSVPVIDVRFVGVEDAQPAPGVLDAIAKADVVVIAPSNPIVSIGPLVAMPNVRAALEARRDTVVAVSPIVGGAALKGPADSMLADLGHDVSVVGVALLASGYAGTLVIDDTDAVLARDVESAGVACVVTDTVMRTPAIAAALARTVLGAAGQ